MNDDPVGTPSPGTTGHRADVGWERATLEKLAFSALAEQRSARRWAIVWRLMWLLLAGSVVWVVFFSGEGVSSPRKPHTALIEIRGEIAAGAEASADNVVGSLKAAFEDAGAQAVVLLIDSPGGSPVQAGIINDEITRLKALHNKKVYAVVEETCASAAYYIAAAADNIYVDKASLVGSIGVLMDGFGFTGLMDKLGVERRLMTAGANKAMLDPFSPQDAEQTAYIQSMLGEIHSQFITVVKAGRGTRLKETPDTFSGLVWSGQQAIAQGLVDELGSLDYVAREVVKAEEVVDYTRRENLGMRLARQLGVSIGEGLYLAARSSGLQFK
ncbi:S49 family peptidase [Hydrogenophaga sp.]|jgi:protease-4|uniref:S49 family peptidase n=1 Tax=Hydrogenophaga sp. TaxID=1904254 RepID=UPI002720774C|nr:S49 family peptidase [Hydrogenophaga sp.]MDO9250664.1 S49 family peptidase [Hydrogenophaga sp.]MDP2408410.1 S49 family peptidase [Hydrogenophaga sp.]MDP3323105.1 S49 family peptidase [Hydrogenophaga sp.]MDP3885606.1 S49 family peptidase [Hydrogenophaga sp.]MDZ4177326.1 S49 family peptidase [Hydrogenophaga sp.]